MTRVQIPAIRFTTQRGQIMEGREVQTKTDAGKPITVTVWTVVLADCEVVS